MNEYILSEAMGGISDELLLEAAEMEPKRRVPIVFRRVASIAAILALLLTWLLWPGEIKTDEYGNIISAPGLLVVRAYAAEEVLPDAEIVSVILDEGLVYTPHFYYDPARNYVEHLPISFELDKSLYQDMNITLEINTNAGIFYKNDPFDINLLKMLPTQQLLTTHYGQHFTVDIDKAIYWTPMGFDYDYMQQQFHKGIVDIERAYRFHNFSNNPSFIDIVIRADNYIIGYCVIEICMIGGELYELQEFTFEALKIVSFPKIDGYWQNVTSEFVQEQINDIHTEREMQL